MSISPLRYILLVTTGFLCQSVDAQHLLVKKNSEYVGVKISQRIFKACGDLQIDIGDGSISNTDRRCVNKPIVLLTNSPVTVTTVNTSERTFTGSLPNSDTRTFYFPENAELGSKLDFSKITAGAKINISAWQYTASEKEGALDEKMVWIANDVKEDKSKM